MHSTYDIICDEGSEAPAILSAFDFRTCSLPRVARTKVMNHMYPSFRPHLAGIEVYYSIPHDGSMVLLYMVCHGSHQYTPNIYTIHGSYGY